jgi:hypothetical protein
MPPPSAPLHDFLELTTPIMAVPPVGFGYCVTSTVYCAEAEKVWEAQWFPKRSSSPTSQYFAYEHTTSCGKTNFVHVIKVTNQLTVHKEIILNY